MFIEIADTINRTKSGRSPRIKAEVIVPDKFFHQVIDAIIPEEGYDINKQKEIDIYKPYTIQIKRKNSEYYINLMIEEETSGCELGYNEEIDADLIAGIDVNIDRIAVSIMSKEGNFLKSKVFYCHEMEYVRTNKRDNIAGETAKEVIDCLLTYTSVIGRFKYTKLYGLSVHEAASFVIGEEDLDTMKKCPKNSLIFLKMELKSTFRKFLVQWKNLRIALKVPDM